MLALNLRSVAQTRAVSVRLALRVPTRVCRPRPCCRGLTARCLARQTLYEVLGVAPGASEKDIKSAYRKKALKLHPDVNKAPDAEQRFMEAKRAFETLGDAKMRAEYDRKLRFGGRTSTGGSSSSSSSSSKSGTSYSKANYRKQPEEDFYGFEDLLRDLDNEVSSWLKEKGKGGKMKSLVEELEDIGSEFLEFLEDALGIKDSGPKDERSSKTDYDWLQDLYEDGQSSKTSGSNYASNASNKSAATNPPTPQAPANRDAEIEAELAALKKKLNKS